MNIFIQIAISCRNFTIISEPPEIVPFDFGSEIVNQKEFAQLSCVVRKGDEPMFITWSLKGDDISSDPAMSTNAIGSRMSLLVITSVEYRHSGVYTCRAENAAGVATYSATLKVNGTESLSLGGSALVISFLLSCL